MDTTASDMNLKNSLPFQRRVPHRSPRAGDKSGRFDSSKSPRAASRPLDGRNAAGTWKVTLQRPIRYANGRAGWSEPGRGRARCTCALARRRRSSAGDCNQRAARTELETAVCERADSSIVPTRAKEKQSVRKLLQRCATCSEEPRGGR